MSLRLEAKPVIGVGQTVKPELNSGEELRRGVGQLPRTGYVIKQLEMGGLTWSTLPSGVPAELVFLHKPGKKHDGNFKTSKYAGLNLFGRNNVIGVSIVEDEAEQKFRFEKMLANPELSYLIKDTGARIEFMSENNFLEWVKYYQKLDQTDMETRMTLLEKLGARADELSGLEMMTQKRFENMKMEVEKLLRDNSKHLIRSRVEVAADYYGLDVAFLEKGGKRPKPVKLCHVREGEFADGLLVEKIIDDMEGVVGLSYRQSGQNKREHYAMVRQMEEEMNTEWETSGLRILAVSEGTAKLWRKYGMFEHPKSNFPNHPELDATILKMYRALFWGKDTLHPGPLAVMGYSLPGHGSNMRFDKLDGLFLQRNKRGVLDYAVVDKLLGSKGEKMVQINNVGGFIVFPDEMDFKDREKYAKAAIVDFNRRTGIVRRNIWFVDNNLLSLIERRGSPFSSEEELSSGRSGISARSAVNYFKPLRVNGTVPEISVEWWRTHPQVGGNIHSLLVRTPKVDYRLIYDLGYSFNPDPAILRVMKQMGKLPPTDDGLKRLLDYGDLAMIAGLYDKAYLQKTAFNWPGLASDEILNADMTARYVVAEIYSRFKKDDISALFPTGIAKSILRNGARILRECYGEREQVIVGATPTHFHYDHMAGYVYVDRDIPQVWGGPIWAAAVGMTLKSPWRNRYTIGTDINAPRVGSQPYPVEQRNIQIYWKSGVKQRLSPFIEQTAYTVDHSVPASWLMTEVDTGASSIKLFNSGDWRWGDYTERSLNMLLNSGVRPDVIFQEGTRLARDEDRSVKEASEQTVKDSFSKYLRDTGKKGLHLVAVSPRSWQRLYNLVEVAKGQGFKVALAEGHAIDTLQYGAVKEMAPMDAEGFDWVMPYTIGEEITVWAKTMTQPRAHQNAIRDMAKMGEMGILTPERLSNPKEANGWIIFVSPFDILRDQFGRIGLVNGVSMWWAAPSVYEKDAAAFWRLNKEFITSAPFNGQWVSDFDVSGGKAYPVKNPWGKAHTSGHANSARIVEVMDALIGSDRKNVPLYLVHTDQPDIARAVLERKLGKKVKIRSDFPRYDPKKPFTTGARFRLG